MASATPLEMMIGTAIIAGVSGYMFGIATSLGVIPAANLFTRRPLAQQTSDDEEESAEEDVDESVVDHAPNWANGVETDRRDGLRPRNGDGGGGDDGKWLSSTEECKMVLVVRTDLGMTKGKIAAQCSHATLANYKRMLEQKPRSVHLRRWERSGQAKIALQVASAAELERLRATAVGLGLVAEVVIDAGRTQITPGSSTVLAIGPAPKTYVDRVTGGLKLL